jgi:hypothetical protein
VPSRTRYDEKIGDRLVRLETDLKTQTINICKSTKMFGDYEQTWEIKAPDPFLTLRDFVGCRSVQDLINLVQSRGGSLRPPKGTSNKT